MHCTQKNALSIWEKVEQTASRKNDGREWKSLKMTQLKLKQQFEKRVWKGEAREIG